MSAQPKSPPVPLRARVEAEGVQPKIRRLLSASHRFGVILLGEALIFWFILLAFQYLGYGGRPGGANGPPWYLLRTLVMAYLAMAAGETRFHLNRRVWTVAGINDAFAVGFAVIEATFLFGIANLMMGEIRPYRLLVPFLAAATRASSRLLGVVPDSSAYSTVKVFLQHANADWVPVAIATLTPGDGGLTVMGVPVVGSAGALDRWIEETHAEGVAFVLRGPSTQKQRDLFAICLAADLPIFIVPEADKWLPGHRGMPLRQL